MARGRDAADVAMTTSFGRNTLERFTGSDGRRYWRGTMAQPELMIYEDSEELAAAAAERICRAAAESIAARGRFRSA